MKRSLPPPIHSEWDTCRHAVFAACEGHGYVQKDLAPRLCVRVYNLRISRGGTAVPQLRKPDILGRPKTNTSLLKYRDVKSERYLARRATDTMSMLCIVHNEPVGRIPGVLSVLIGDSGVCHMWVERMRIQVSSVEELFT